MKAAVSYEPGMTLKLENVELAITLWMDLVGRNHLIQKKVRIIDNKD